MNERIYYEVLSGTDEHEECAKYAAAFVAVKQSYSDYAKEMGAIAWMEGFGGIYGLVYEDDSTAPVGLRVQKRKAKDGNTIQVPNKKTEAGKAIIKRMNELKALPSDRDFCQRFNIPTNLEYKGEGTSHGSMLITLNFMNTAWIAWQKLGEFWVVLPDIAALIKGHQAEGYTTEPASFSPPPGLKPSTRARYDLYVARCKVEEEEAKTEA